MTRPSGVDEGVHETTSSMGVALRFLGLVSALASVAGRVTRHRRDQPLAHRLALVVFACSIALAFVATGVQLAVEYRSGLEELKIELVELELAHRPALRHAVDDGALLALQLEGIRALPHVARVEVARPPVVPRALAATSVSHRFVVEGMHDATTFTLVADKAHIVHAVLDRALLVLASQTARALLVSAVLVFLFRRLVSRHLEQMARHARRLRVEDVDEPLELDRRPRAERDELDDVVAACNELREAMKRRLAEETQHAEVHRRLLAREQAARTDAEHALAVREQFLAIASHELRTPLTPLSLQLQRAQARLVAGKPEEAQALLRTASRQVARLHRLAGDLLDVAAIASGHLHLEREDADLVDLVTRTAQRSRGTLELTADLDVSGHVDVRRVERVVEALLDNAFKFGRGRPVHVRVEKQPGRALIVVRDEGIGIEPAELERIFERFGRAVSSRNYGGLGFGLYLARAIVAAHGGVLNVASDPGHGATFTVELPAADATRTSLARSSK
jgi:signal transduction histidine kinase